MGGLLGFLPFYTWLLRVFYESSDVRYGGVFIGPGPWVGLGHHVSGINFDTAA